MLNITWYTGRNQDESLSSKVKSTIPHEECWWGAHLPYLGLEPVGG